MCLFLSAYNGCAYMYVCMYETIYNIKDHKYLNKIKTILVHFKRSDLSQQCNTQYPYPKNCKHLLLSLFAQVSFHFYIEQQFDSVA